jgi:O-antigen ligase
MTIRQTDRVRNRGYISSGDARIAEPPKPRATSLDHADPSSISPAIRWAFYAMIFSIPFEHVNLGLGDVAISKLAGYLFLLTVLLQPSVCLRPISAACWCFIIYVGVCAALGLFLASGYADEVLDRLFTLVQMVVLFHLAYNLFRHEQVATGALMALIAGCVVLSGLTLTGISSTQTGTGLDAQRITAFGENANRMAGVLTLGLVSLAALVSSRTRSAGGLRILAWAFLALLGMVILLTGSRGGLLALVAGLIALMWSGATAQARRTNIILLVTSLAMLVLAVLMNDTILRRWEDTIQGGNLAHREQIFPAAWNLFLESPLIGWGPARNLYELGWRISDVTRYLPSHQMDTHNLFLFILTQVGIVGSIPFFAGFVLCLNSAWKARRGAHGILPLALLVVLFVVNNSGNWIHFKLQWIVLAYALASGSGIALTSALTPRGAVRPT